MSLGSYGWPSVISVDPCQAADVLASAAGHNGTLCTPSLIFFWIPVIILERFGCLRIKRMASVIERNSVSISRYIDFESVRLIMSLYAKSPASSEPGAKMGAKIKRRSLQITA